jgi:hypothetical protein
MSRKSVLLGVGILLLFAVSLGATMVVLLRHEPAYYRRAAVPPGPEREALSKMFWSKAGTFWELVKNSPTWQGTFSEEQINSFFEEDFLRSAANKFTLPDHITDPRVVFEPERVRLGFRYHIGRFSTIVSIDIRVWLTNAEPNVVALEIQGMRAGALPISAQSILERLSETAESNNVKLSWYRYNGNPVAILHFQSDQRATVKLENLDVQPGKLSIKGQSLEPMAPVMAAPEAKP